MVDMIEPINAEQMEQALEQIDQALTPTATEDRAWTARLVGEFSAGKTRVMGTLLETTVHSKLLPISSREAQTKVPLEVVFGELPSLQHIERDMDHDDGSVRVVRSISHFPQRQELEVVVEERRRGHRLLLSAPVHELMLPQDPQMQDSGPTSIRLIDSPGWNNEEDTMAQPLEDERMVGLVYVVSSYRMESKENDRLLKEALARLGNCVDHAGERCFLAIVTHWDEDSPNLRERFEERIARHAEQYAGRVKQHARYVDFDRMSDQEKQDFRHWFWSSLRSGIEGAARDVQQPGVVLSLEQSVLEEFRKRLRLLGVFLEENRTYLARLQGLSVPERLRTVLAPFVSDRQDWPERILRDSWELPRPFDAKAFPESPLAGLWNGVVRGRALEVEATREGLQRCVEAALRNLDLQGTTPLQGQVMDLLEEPLRRARRAALWAESLLPPTLRVEVEKGSAEQLVATLVAIAAVQTALAPVLKGR